jgi:hypothetical protein
VPALRGEGGDVMAEDRYAGWTIEDADPSGYWLIPPGSTDPSEWISVHEDSGEIAQLAEAKALLKEAEPYTVTGGWALYDLSATWEDRRRALLGEE